MSTRERPFPPVGQLITLGFDLDANGFAGREAAIRQLVRGARLQGVSGAAVDVLADTVAPEVARMRAFAAVAAALAHPAWASVLDGAA